jgi:hypothetical protein
MMSLPMPFFSHSKIQNKISADSFKLAVCINSVDKKMLQLSENASRPATSLEYV